MKNLEESIEIIKKYKELIYQTEERIGVLNHLDSKRFNTGNYIEIITFEDSTVHVSCNADWFGMSDTTYFEFPLEWLFISEAELTEKVLSEKIKREELAKVKLVEEKMKEQEERDEKERREYNRLKQKFDR